MSYLSGDFQETGDDQEQGLRPQRLVDYIGQSEMKEELSIYIQAASGREEALDHVLLYGPPGLGKTTLATVIAHEMGVNIQSTSGPAIEKTGDLLVLLNELQAGDVLFIDEIHRLPRVVEEMLYSAMEDFYVDIIVGQDEAAYPVHFPLPPFTLIGATTRAGALSQPLRHRFGIVKHMRYYTEAELAAIIQRTSKVLATPIDSAACLELARRSRGTPRIANRLFKRVRDFAQVYHNDGHIDLAVVNQALTVLNIDQIGLDETDRRLLQLMIEFYDGGPVGLSTLAASLSEEKATIEDMYEPYLIQQGFMQRTPRGRMVTGKAYDHLNIQRKED
ncbi:Holliday junction branch migration DNA helicase RuvB [Aerococcus urinaehominis]|nr:Holliday junction branch migration DNA helicase RuvB [Aerococcus urinaehominis]